MTNIALSMIETAADTLKVYTADLFEKKLIDVIDVQYMREMCIRDRYTRCPMVLLCYR